jgi:hypothetical protein
MASPYNYNYIVVDEPLGHYAYPEAFEPVFERARTHSGSNLSASCFMFKRTTRDSEFVRDTAIRSSIGRDAALRLVHLFRALMKEACRRQNEVSWVRIFCSVDELRADNFMIQAVGRDRMCPMIGVGTTATKYEKEQLQIRGAVSMHCGLEAFVDLCTPDHRAIAILMVDETQTSRIGRIFADPMFELDLDKKTIARQWLASKAKFTYPWSNHAWFDMVMNYGLDEFRKLGCRPVVGSLGLGMGLSMSFSTDPLRVEDIWWEYGNGEWQKFNDFLMDFGGDRAIDAHFWLEDEHGNAYDVVRPHVILALLNSGHMLPEENFPLDVSGWTKEQLKAKGFHYVPAPRDTQHLLLSLMIRQQRVMWEFMAQTKPDLFQPSVVEDMLVRN